MQQHFVSPRALLEAMAQLNHCWPRWWELTSADIQVGDRLIHGPHPEPWQGLVFGQSAQGLLAALNPQPLPPLVREIAVALEIADRLIGTASLATYLDGWLKHEGIPLIARRLNAEVEDLCPPLSHVVVKPVGPSHPDPEPWPIKLSALAQLTMGARFVAAAAKKGSGELGAAYADAGDKLTRAGLSNLDRER